MARILVVDDDQAMLQLIRRVLEKDRHLVKLVFDANTVPDMDFSKYDLILLDIMMPGLDGFELCRRIRSRADCPIIFLTAKTQENDIVRGLGLGADDYMSKSFGTAELRARVNAHLRRDTREKKNAFTVSGIVFQLNAKEAEAQGKKLLFTKSEYEICEYLALHHGQTFTREQIYEAVFGFDGESDSSVISTHIKNIRGKLDACNMAPIETVWGVGYKWV
ncbi:response regulator transcription factor [Lachnospiraceae bacterium ASD3451]|uniref:response regulator transcription factor n=1 Tax=Diplocloster agilis TaxID=2850323 RepID=UPI001DE80305|nr:response regulator transcription factor [Diplocloster agilis]MBU9742649.1 response regulator transcription factor [Diplocloster agilis]